MKRKVLKSIGVLALAAFVGLQSGLGTVWAAGEEENAAQALEEQLPMDREPATGTSVAGELDADLPGDGAEMPDAPGRGEAVAQDAEDGEMADDRSVIGEGAAAGSDGGGEAASDAMENGNEVSSVSGASRGSINTPGGDVPEDWPEAPNAKLATPVVDWDGWRPFWPAVDGANGWYGFEAQISRDGGNSWETFAVENPSYMGGDSPVRNMGLEFDIGTDEDGATFRFRAKALNRSYEEQSSEWSEWSECKTYTKPENQLATVECWWDEENPGVVCWNPVDGAWGYMTELYDAATDRMIGYTSEFNGKMQIDYSSRTAGFGAQSYYAKVWALSSDIDACANGSKGQTGVYDTGSADCAVPVPQWGWAGDDYSSPNAWDVSWTQVGIRVYDLAVEKQNGQSGEWEWFGGTRIEDREHESYTTRAQILESGTYRFRVCAWYQMEDGSYKASDWSDWVEKTYSKPEQKLGNVSGEWDKDRPGVFRWSLVDNAAGYWAELHKVEFDSQNPQAIRIRGQYNSQFTEADFSEEIGANGAGQYYIIIRALSDDIDVCANGDGVKSEIYDTRITSDNVGGALEETLSQAQQGGDVASMLEALTSKFDISEIAIAMQTNLDVRKQMKQLELLYAEQKKVTVAPSVVAGEAAELIDASKVSVVGAALNGADGSSMALHVDMAKPENRVDVPANLYAGSVQLDISLMNGDISLHELKMPVTITMPVPLSLNKERLTVVHYNADGQGEDVAFRDNGDGTVTFTVTHFSTFLFAEKKESGTTPNGGNDSGTTPNGDSGSTQGTPDNTQDILLSPQTGQEAFSIAALMAVACSAAACVLFAGSQARKRRRR